MSEAAVTCPVCRSELLVPTSVALSYGRLHGCTGCGSGILLPRPTQHDLSAQHANDDYFDHPYFEARRQLTPDLAYRYGERAAELVALIGPLAGRRVLEVGCDTGLFVGYLRDRHGAASVGVDVAHKAVAEARKAGLDVRLGTLEQLALPPHSFDVICAYDLIEHVADPAGFLKEAASILAPGGIIVIETPNYDGLIYRLGRGLAQLPLGLAVTRAGQKRLWPPFHVQYFNAASLSGILAANGFTATNVQGRELASAELAVGWPVKPIVLGIFALSHAVRANTLLHAHARRAQS
ncbi:MAG: class I SAM-dependent methyltransferase [Hyphomicrobiaceae bacterium]